MAKIDPELRPLSSKEREFIHQIVYQGLPREEAYAMVSEIEFTEDNKKKLRNQANSMFFRPHVYNYYQALMEEIRERINTSFVPDNLDYLHKGGRVSGMVKVAAAMFKIHPQILMNDGQLVPGKNYKGKMSFLIKQYIDDLKELYPNYDKSRCFVTHSSADRDLVEVATAKVKETFEFDEIIETVAGSIITSHCGKGTLGVLFVYNK